MAALPKAGPPPARRHLPLLGGIRVPLRRGRTAEAEPLRCPHDEEGLQSVGSAGDRGRPWGVHAGRGGQAGAA